MDYSTNSATQPQSVNLNEPTPKQLAYLRSLGYQGPTPPDRFRASALIQYLKDGEGDTPLMCELLRVTAERDAFLRELEEQRQSTRQAAAAYMSLKKKLAQEEAHCKGFQAERQSLKEDRNAWLKNLLILAHPDKWSQGQPATALAYEITILVNDLRHQEGGR